MKNNIFLCAFLLTGVALFAQPVNRPTYAMTVQTAEEQKEKEDHYRSWEWYKQAYDESKDKSLAIFIADMNYNLRDYTEAAQWYARALKTGRKDKEEVPEEKRFEYARSLKMAEKYDEAIEQFNEFISKTQDPGRKELAESEKIGCEFAKVSRPQDGVNVLHSGKEVNTKNSEYSAWLTNDNKEMYFSGPGTDDLLVIENDSSDEVMMKIHKSTRSEKGWSKPEALNESVNRPGWHNVNVSLSPESELYIFMD